MARPGKVRKEIHFTATEMKVIEDLAREFGIDRTAMIRVLISLGKRVLQIVPDTVDKSQRKTD